MKAHPLEISEVKVIEPQVFEDNRGFFLETFKAKDYKQEIGIEEDFVQDNHSRSSKGVLRGLHFQKKNPQGKLVRVSRGSVLDVAVDIRPDSPTFGKSELFELSDKNFRQLWIPPGFAHGFLVLSEIADFQYKCTQVYDQEDEESIHWQDPDLMISWPSDIQISVSERDSNAQSFNKYCAK